MFYLCCWGWGTAMYAYVWLNQVQSSTHTCVLVVLVVLSYFIKLQVLHFAWPAQTTLYFSILGPPIIWGGPHFADLLYFLPTEKIHTQVASLSSWIMHIVNVRNNRWNFAYNLLKFACGRYISNIKRHWWSTVIIFLKYWLIFWLKLYIQNIFQ